MVVCDRANDADSFDWHHAVRRAVDCGGGLAPHLDVSDLGDCSSDVLVDQQNGLQVREETAGLS